MKKIILGLVGLLILTDVYGQSSGFQLTPTVGYMWGGSARGYNGEINLGDNVTYGVTGSLEAGYGTHIELSWSNMQTEADRKIYGESTEKLFDVAVNHCLLGATQTFPTDNEDVQPFSLIAAGATQFHPKNADNSYVDEWFFSMTFGLGLKYFFSDRIGIRLQGRLILPMLWGGGGIWCGTGSGCGTSVNTYAVFVEGTWEVD